MMNKIREEKGRPFNPKELTTSCVVNVVMLMLLGYRFDHSNEDFAKLKWAIHEGMATYSIFLDLFPAVRHIPYFKKMIKYYITLSTTIHTTIYSLLDRCLEVCNSTSWREKFSHWPPWASKMTNTFHYLFKHLQLVILLTVGGRLLNCSRLSCDGWHYKVFIIYESMGERICKINQQ